MLATVQRIITFSLPAAALAWALYSWNIGRPGLAFAGAALIVFGYALFLAAEFFIIAVVNRGDPAPKASALQLLRAWWGEVLAAPQVFCWRQPFFAHEVPDAPGAPGRRGIVFIHGFVCNRGFWTPWLKRLRARGIPFVAVSLEPVFGEIDDYVPLIERAVAQLEASTGRAPMLVCHSMGGLVARAWLRAHQGDARVHRVVTIGSPHRGTWLGRFGSTPNARQMCLDGDWLCELAAQEPAERYRRFVCYYGHCDNIVFPASTATLPGADNRHVSGIAHVDMAFDERLIQEVLGWTESPDASSAAASSEDEAEAGAEAALARARTGTSAQ